MKPGRVRQELAAATQSQHLIRLWRRDVDQFPLDCYVMALGRRWVLLAVLGGGVVLDGWSCVRLRDVSKVQVSVTGEFVRRALELRSSWPPKPPDADIDLTTRRRLLASAGEAFSLITVHPERRRRDVAYIGKVVGIQDDALTLWHVTPVAVWQDEPEPMPAQLRDVTKVDFGGSYEEALLLVSGAPPTER